MAFIGQETVRKRQRHNFLWRMYTLIAVFVHFNRFIDLKINFHTNLYNLASSMLLWFWAPCVPSSFKAVPCSLHLSHISNNCLEISHVILSCYSILAEALGEGDALWKWFQLKMMPILWLQKCNLHIRHHNGGNYNPNLRMEPTFLVVSIIDSYVMVYHCPVSTRSILLTICSL